MPACPKCSGEMEAGFIADLTYGAILASSWIEGEPEVNWRGTAKIKGKRKIDIATERCTKCGFLESYARA